MIPNEQTPKEFEDETEAAIREYETKRDDFVRLLNGRIVLYTIMDSLKTMS